MRCGPRHVCLVCLHATPCTALQCTVSPIPNENLGDNSRQQAIPAVAFLNFSLLASESGRRTSAKEKIPFEPLGSYVETSLPLKEPFPSRAGTGTLSGPASCPAAAVVADRTPAEVAVVTLGPSRKAARGDGITDWFLLHTDMPKVKYISRKLSQPS